jgi:hypothetical protein
MNQTFFKSLTFMILSSFLQASDSLRYEIESLGTLTQVPKMHLAKGTRATDNPKAIYYDSLPYEGKNTRAYAWFGLPQKTVGKVPGVVLVHVGLHLRSGFSIGIEMDLPPLVLQSKGKQIEKFLKKGKRRLGKNISGQVLHGSECLGTPIKS